MNYNADPWNMSVAHFCRHFKSRKTAARMSAAQEGISCSRCENWGAEGCTKHVFEYLSNDMDLI